MAEKLSTDFWYKDLDKVVVDTGDIKLTKRDMRDIRAELFMIGLNSMNGHMWRDKNGYMAYVSYMEEKAAEEDKEYYRKENLKEALETLKKYDIKSIEQLESELD